MGTGGRAAEEPGIIFKNSVLYFGPKFWWGVALSIVVILVTAVTAGSLPNGLLLGGAAVAGALIGTLFSPSPKPKDHSQLANESVTTLLDIQVDLERARASIGLAVGEQNSGLQAIHLASAEKTIKYQDERLARSLENWNSVAPDVADRVIDARKNGRRRFKQLVEEGNWDE